ncbi:MAG TPA: hypothetical protein VI942_08045 [Thermoanaerobaculia bacterium]|nr:hypothetical protein [Thermoanaerobaculia bacterium]
MVSKRVRIVLFALASVAGFGPLAAPSYAQILDNPTFDADILGWYPLGISQIEWSSLDFAASPDSGSARVTNLTVGAGDATGSTQCVTDPVPEESYWLRARVWMPGGQNESGGASLIYQIYSGTNCGTGYLTSGFSGEVASADSDIWRCVGLRFDSPAGTQSMRIRLSVRKTEAGGSLAANFDDLLLVPALFLDDFECGNTYLWTVTQTPI